MKTRADSGLIPLVVMGVALYLADFVSAAENAKDVNTYNQRTGAVRGS
jgi:hypothetical protein